MSVRTASIREDLALDMLTDSDVVVEQVDDGAHEHWRLYGADADGPFVVVLIRMCSQSRQAANWRFSELRGRHVK